MEQKWTTERLPEPEQFEHLTIISGRQPVSRSADAIIDSTRPFELGFAEPLRQVSVQLPRERLLEAALGNVEELLSDPDLSPRDVADRIAVSPRYLHRLFAERGTTFGRWLLERRLERGRGGLVDPAQPDRAIGDIAHAVGFRDPSYFARAFKARYGITPRDARLQAFSDLAMAA